MSHKQQRAFCESIRARFPRRFIGARVLDVGSLDVNGSTRDLFSNSFYLGIDLVAGKGVDAVCKVSEVSGRFSVVISTEALEHDPDWEQTLRDMQNRMDRGGLLVLTCAGPGRKEHGTRKHPMPGMSNEQDYYRNLSPADLLRVIDADRLHSYSATYSADNFDTYFWGIGR